MSTTIYMMHKTFTSIFSKNVPSVSHNILPLRRGGGWEIFGTAFQKNFDASVWQRHKKRKSCINQIGFHELSVTAENRVPHENISLQVVSPDKHRVMLSFIGCIQTDHWWDWCASPPLLLCVCPSVHQWTFWFPLGNSTTPFPIDLKYNMVVDHDTTDSFKNRYQG